MKGATRAPRGPCARTGVLVLRSLRRRISRVFTSTHMATPPGDTIALVLNEIRTRATSNVLRSTDVAEGSFSRERAATTTATYIRGGLLNEIQKGKTLRPVATAQEPPAPSATLMRGNMFMELRFRRPAVPAAATNSSRDSHAQPRNSHVQPRHSRVQPPPKLGSSRATSVASSASVKSSKRSAAASEADSPGGAIHAGPIIKAGVLHKRASNGIWQKRYFILTPTAVQYTSQEPKKGKAPEDLLAGSSAHGAAGASAPAVTRMPMVEVHDVHPLHSSTEFVMFHNERRLRLRAPSSDEARKWVSALITAGLDSNRLAGSGSTKQPSASSGVLGLVAPSALIVGVADPTGREAVVYDAMPLALAEMTRQLRCPDAVCEVVQAHAAGLVDGEYELPLPALLAEWLGQNGAGGHSGGQGRGTPTPGGCGTPTVHEHAVDVSESPAGAPASATTVAWALDGPLGQLLRWTHPRVLQPALATLQAHLNGGRLHGLDQLDYGEHTPAGSSRSRLRGTGGHA